MLRVRKISGKTPRPAKPSWRGREEHMVGQGTWRSEQFQSKPAGLAYYSRQLAGGEVPFAAPQREAAACALPHSATSVALLPQNTVQAESKLDAERDLENILAKRPVTEFSKFNLKIRCMHTHTRVRTHTYTRKDQLILCWFLFVQCVCSSCNY